MRLKNYLEEKATPQQAWKKAEQRFQSFQAKAKDQDQLSKMINLRTQKTKDAEKLRAWYEYLENENFHDEAEIAYKKWKQLTKESISLIEATGNYIIIDMGPSFPVKTDFDMVDPDGKVTRELKKFTVWKVVGNVAKEVVDSSNNVKKLQKKYNVPDSGVHKLK